MSDLDMRTDTSLASTDDPSPNNPSYHYVQRNPAFSISAELSSQTPTTSDNAALTVSLLP